MAALGVSAAESIFDLPALRCSAISITPFRAARRFMMLLRKRQAGERASHLFRLATSIMLSVIGTGDLSELAPRLDDLWCGGPYVALQRERSVPRRLIQYLIRWVISSAQFDKETNATLDAILDTEISPELVPHADGDSSKPAQKTAEKLGPYELQDFNLYFITRYGFSSKQSRFFLSHHAWSNRSRGDWPDLLPPEKRLEYDLPSIKKWLEVFPSSLFKLSQFKPLRPFRMAPRWGRRPLSRRE